MQEKKQRGLERNSGDIQRKKSSCFSNIKIFLISECALMLAQGTVGAYLVSRYICALERHVPALY